MVGYGEGTYKNSQRVFDDDPGKGLNQQFSHFDLILRRINLQDGTVASSHNVFAPGDVQQGWFGLTNDFSPMERIDTAAEDLWQAFINYSKDH